MRAAFSRRSLALPLALLLALAAFPAPAGAADVPPDSLPAAWAAILRGPERVRIEHRANRRVPATFVSKLPSWTNYSLGRHVETLVGERAVALMASLQLERWLDPPLPPRAAPCPEVGSRRESLSLELTRGRDTARVVFDLARGTIVMYRSDQPIRGARVGRESASILRSLAEAFPGDSLFAGIRPCDRDAPPDSSVRGFADVIDVSKAEELPSVLRQVAPKYPSDARKSGIEGAVMVQVLVGKDGWVRETLVARSIPELDQAAVLAVEQWRFNPARMHGEPVPVWVAVPVNFKLR